VLDRLALIRVAKRAGFRVSEIQTLLRGLGRSTSPGGRWRALAERKRAELAARLEELERAKRMLDAVTGCACPTLADCGRALREEGCCP
jgi:DNA-binding transcriptional MerR regulator